MSTRLAWLSVGTLTYGWLIVGCTGADETAVFSDPSVTGGGRNAALGGSAQQAGNSAKAGDKGSGGSSSNQSGASNGGTPAGGGSSSVAGSSGDTGQSGSAGDSNSGGLPGNGGSAQAGTGNGGQPGSAGQAGSAGQGGSGGQPGGGLDCNNAADCVAHNQYCLKTACGESPGVCTGFARGEPVCGCDGVTYYDGSLAMAAGRSVQRSGVCSGPGAVGCEGSSCDDDNLTCGKVALRGEICPAPALLPGVCWALPAQCPLNQPAPFSVCLTEKCAGLCDAVRSGKIAIGNPLKCPN